MTPARLAAGAGLSLCSPALLCRPRFPRAQSGRPMMLDDLLAAVRVADPQLSPDSRTVVLCAHDDRPAVGPPECRPLERAGGRRRRQGCSSAATSRRTRRAGAPSGKRLAFISTRDGAAQVFVADADGSGVRRITDLAMGVQPPLIFSPDGTRIAFVSDVYPECADEACNKRRKEEIEKNPVKVRRLTRLLSRHWDEWRENVRHHVMVADLESKRVVDVTPGDFDSPPGQQEDAPSRFRPDGREIAFVSNREGNDREAWTTNNDVFLVAGDRRRREEADAGRRRRCRSRCSRRTAAPSSCARSGAAGSSRIAGISTPTIAPAVRSASSSRRPISRSATSRSRRMAPRSGSPPADQGREHLYTLPAGRRHAEADRRGRRDQRAAPRQRLRRVLEVVADDRRRNLPRRGNRRQREGPDDGERGAGARGGIHRAREPDA